MQAADEELVDDPFPENEMRKYCKRKATKRKRPLPGKIQIARTLEGTVLFCCPQCNMVYTDKARLENHLISHNIIRRFICDICGIGLKRKEHLDRHKLSHTSERPYVCDVCNKGFKRKEHLNLHYLIHTGESMELCPECGKFFYRKDHMIKHEKSHEAKRLKEAKTGQECEATLEPRPGEGTETAQEDSFTDYSWLKYHNYAKDSLPLVQPEEVEVEDSRTDIMLFQASEDTVTPITLIHYHQFN